MLALPICSFSGANRRGAAAARAAEDTRRSREWLARASARGARWIARYRICEFEPGSKVTTQKLRDIVHSEDRPLFDAVIEHAIAGNDVDYAFRIVTCGGVVKHLRVVGRLSEHIDGRPIFMGTVQDVTASRLAEEALKAREEWPSSSSSCFQTGSVPLVQPSPPRPLCSPSYDCYLWSREYLLDHRERLAIRRSNMTGAPKAHS